MPSVLYLIALASFAANLSVRAIDPVIPHIADDLSISIAQAAGLSSALAFTFAIAQPIIGAFADLIGKARVMVACLALLGIGSIMGAFATTFPVLLVTRILCGIGAGGVFPVTLSLTSDLIPVGERQIAISRVLAGAMIGNILGSAVGGVVGDLLGWRGVLELLGISTLLASVAVGVGLSRASTVIVSGASSLAALWHGYKVLFHNPRTRVCYSIVFFEGCCILGVFPFVAAFLFDLGETRLSIAGIVIAGFALFFAVYQAEIIRGGIQSIPVGQDEAAKALGLSYWQRVRMIILPQAFRYALPPTINQIVTTFKETSLVVIVGFFEIMASGNAAYGTGEWTFAYVEVYAFIAMIYFAFVFTLSRYGAYLERVMRVGQQ